MKAETLLFALIRTVICDQTPDAALKAACTPENLEAACVLAARHDLTHLVGQAVSLLELPENAVTEKCRQAAMVAFLRCVRRQHTYEELCRELELAAIPFIPLKGSVLKDYYPQDWMRTSCDIDILVKAEDLNRAVAHLVEKLNYSAGKKSDHDISLHSPGGIHLELHYDTIQERFEVNGCRDVLGRIWDYAEPREPGACHLWLTDDMFYVYHMAHMAKHFSVGGCGIRSFLDVWILNHKVSFCPEKRRKLLEESGLLQFASGVERVSRVWFSNASPEEMDTAVSSYILRAGLYGDNKNRAALGQAKQGSKWKYLLTQRIFMPYHYLKDKYPVLKKRKWLTPVYQVVRWAQMLFGGGFKTTVKELKANVKTEGVDAASAAEILKYLGL